MTKKGRYNIWLEKYGEDEANKRYIEWKLKISEYQQYKLESGWTHTEEAIKYLKQILAKNYQKMLKIN